MTERDLLAVLDDKLRRGERPWLVLADLDRFKAINHLYGKAIADVLLARARAGLGLKNPILVGDEAAALCDVAPDLRGEVPPLGQVVCLSNFPRLTRTELQPLRTSLAAQDIHLDPWPRRRGVMVLVEHATSWEAAVARIESVLPDTTPCRGWLWNGHSWCEGAAVPRLRWSWGASVALSSASQTFDAAEARLRERKGCPGPVEPMSLPFTKHRLRAVGTRDFCRFMEDSSGVLLEMVPEYPGGQTFKDLNSRYGRRTGDALIRLLEDSAARAVAGFSRRVRARLAVSRQVDRFRIYFKGHPPNLTAFLERFQRAFDGMKLAARMVQNTQRLDSDALLHRVALTSLAGGAAPVVWQGNGVLLQEYDASVEAIAEAAREAQAWSAHQVLTLSK